MIQCLLNCEEVEVIRKDIKKTYRESKLLHAVCFLILALLLTLIEAKRLGLLSLSLFGIKTFELILEILSSKILGIKILRIGE